MENRQNIAQQRLLKLFEAIDDYAIILLDENGRVENWTEGARKIKGYTAAEIIGQNFEVFYTHEDRLGALPLTLLKTAAEKESVSTEGWRLRKDGSKFWGSILIRAIYDAAGQLIGYSKIVKDLTAEKTANETLRDFEERYSKMISEVTDYAIILLDADGNIENWNKGAQTIKGYLPEEIIGRNFRVFYSAEDQAQLVPERLIGRAALEGRAQSEGWRIRKDGTRFWGLITITALHGQEGQVIGFSKVTRDLTDKLFAEQSQLQYINDLDRKNKELDRQNKELEQFTYIASHDLQEPLRTISSFNTLFRDSYRPILDEDALLILNIIDQSANRMSNLIHGLLDYSRIGVVKTVVPINCNLLVANIEMDFFHLIEEAQATLVYSDLPVINGYETEIIQLFQNTISNAIKYRAADRKPQVRITCTEDDKKWTFSVSDNGIGMDPKYIHKIFLIFQRLHNRDDYQGSGIGLANCKKITDLHDGEIWAESVPGEGSQFYFSISKHI